MSDLVRRFSLAAAVAAAVVAAPAVAASLSDAAQRAYVQGRLAMAGQDYALAASRLAQVLKADSADTVRRQALEVAILQGDMKQATSLALAIDMTSAAATGDAGDFLILLVRAADRAARSDWAGYRLQAELLDTPARRTGVTPIVAPILAAYGDLAVGRTDAALQRIDPEPMQGVRKSYFAEHRAHLLAISGRWAEAADAYEALATTPGGGQSRLRVAAASAALQAARQTPQEATTLRARAAALLGADKDNDPLLTAARVQLLQRGRADVTMAPRTVADGLVQLFIRLSADFARGDAGLPALATARLAVLLGPAAPEAWLVVAEQLAQTEQYEQALAALDRVSPGSGWQTYAATRRVSVLQRMGRVDDARGLLEARTQATDATVVDWLRLADLDRATDRLDDARVAYGQAIELLPDEADGARAQILFHRGSMIDSGGSWAEAEADLRAAVRLQPDNPVYLNYLGYSLLDHGGDVAEARRYIAGAYAAAPENGAIIDSMGWLEYREGNVTEAARLLEMAYAAEPADPTIVDHLGDALWRAGRRIEARHAWTSARQLEDDAERRARIEAKLAHGLDRLAAR